MTDYLHIIQIEQFSKGVPAILSIDRKMDSMLEKQDRMETSITGEIRDLRNDLCSHLDQRLSAMEHDVQQIKTKIGLI